MAKENQNITTWKGDYRKIEFTVEDVANLTGCSAKWAMSATANSVPLISKSSANPAQITISGLVITVILVPTDTDYLSGINAGTYYHELEITDSSSNPSTAAIGTVTLKDAIINPA